MSGQLVFHLIPHTHWDREWYLPLAAFRVRLVGMMDDLIDRLERDPTYRSFSLDGQTVLMEDYLQLRPERETALAALVREGRLETGPWYVLADEQIVSGEALIRNLLLGRATAERLGRRSDVLYSPDAFGHPAILPDLAREFGIEHGVLWRGLGSAEGVQRDLWMWHGPAGGSLLVYHLPPAGYEIGGALPADPARLPAAWSAIRPTLVTRASSPHIAVFVGADHHWAYPDIGRLRALLAAVEREHEVRISRLDQFLEAAAGTARSVLELSGELRHSYGYTWTLQGVHSTRAPLKRRNSELEVGLERLAEPLVALTGAADLRAALTHAWRTLIQNHFHDSICGTASDDIARAMTFRFAEVEVAGREIVRRAVHRALGHDADRARKNTAGRRPRLALWNPAARTRGGVVVAKLSFFRRDVLVGPPDGRTPRLGNGWQPMSLVSAAGESVPLQVLGREASQERLDADRHYPDQDEVDLVTVAFRSPPLAGLGWTALEPGRERDAVEGGVRVRGSTLDNGLIEVRVESDGSLTLRDHRTRERFTGIFRLESGGDAGDTYTYAPADGDRIRTNIGRVHTRTVATGPLVGALEVRYPLHAATGSVHIRLIVQLFADSPIIRCVLEVDNQATDHRLRARLSTGLRGTHLIAGTQFGSISRAEAAAPTRNRMETPVRTTPAHRFAAAAEGDRGLAVLTPGFFEVEWADGDLLLTLLRSMGQLSRADLPTRPGNAGWPTATPLAQSLGTSRIAFALAPVTEAEVRRGDVVPELWEDAFLPLQSFWLRDAVELTIPADSITLAGEGLVISAIKPAEESDALVLRCYNATAETVEGAWRFGVPRSRAARTRADERESEPAALSDGGRTLPFRAGPHAWVTHTVA